jgi:hypothetical protein
MWTCIYFRWLCQQAVFFARKVPLAHLLLDSDAPNLGPLISPWEIYKFENCWYKTVRTLEVLKLLFLQFLNLSSSQRDMSCPILGDLSNNRWSGGNQESLMYRQVSKESPSLTLQNILHSFILFYLFSFSFVSLSSCVLLTWWPIDLFRALLPRKWKRKTI